MERIEFGELATDRSSSSSTTGRTVRRARCVSRQRRSCPIAVHFVEEPQPGISFARNRAVAEAIAPGAPISWPSSTTTTSQRGLARGSSCADSARPKRTSYSGSGGCRATCSYPTGCTEPAISGRPVQRTEPVRPARLGWHLQCAGIPAAAREPDWGIGPFRPEFAQRRRGHRPVHPRDRGRVHLRLATDSIVERGWEPDRLTLRGVLRRGFVLAGSRVHTGPRPSAGRAGAPLGLVQLAQARQVPAAAAARLEPLAACAACSVTRRWARVYAWAACATTSAARRE